MATTNQLREYLRDLLWSQWHELGVSTTVPRRHSDDLIDPEPLIAMTALHSDLDPRLRDESIDWILSYGTYVSRARLKNILADWDERRDPNFLVYAATVNAHGKADWPTGGRALPFRSRARAVLEDLSRPALLSLRIRAIFGVGARAELIRALLSRPLPAMTAADLAGETSYRKRNVLNELEPLRFAGVVKSFRAVNAERYSLAMVDAVAALVGPLPTRSTRWAHTFGALHRIFELTQRSARSDLQRSVEVVRFLEERRSLLAAAEMYPPPLPPGAEAWRRFTEWATDHVRAVARQ